MKIIADPTHALADGLAAIRREFDVPTGFSPEVLAAAKAATARVPVQHVDRTGRPFVTLDPATSTDLDQAFAIERSGGDLLLHYAIADVAWFVDDGDPIDVEAWRRGATQYLPDGKAGLYPPVLGEGAASLLPDSPRPAVVFTVRVDRDGSVLLDAVERAVIRSRAKLAYDSVRPADLPADFADLAMRIRDAEDRRGASRVDPPSRKSLRSATVDTSCCSVSGWRPRIRTPRCRWPPISRLPICFRKPGPACSASWQVPMPTPWNGCGARPVPLA